MAVFSGPRQTVGAVTNQPASAGGGIIGAHRGGISLAKPPIQGAVHLLTQRAVNPILLKPVDVRAHASALDAAELVSDAAELVSGTTLATLLLAPNNESKLPKSASPGSQPLDVLKSPSAAVKSVPSVGSMLEIELIIGSIITSNSSACADGAAANGVMPNAKNAPALAIKPTTARRSAFALRDRRFRFGATPGATSSKLRPNSLVLSFALIGLSFLVDEKGAARQ